MKNWRIFHVTSIFLAGLCGLAAAAMPASFAKGQSAGDSSSPQVGANPAPMSMAQPVPEGQVTKVEDNKKICMVTNRAYDKPQIPVTVNGKTYYGCCEMCKTTLTNNPNQRTAVDPVSKKKVDKSEAVIGVTANGGVVYFQNDKDLDAYNAKMASK
jgi:YHS domain-containing protein